MASIKQVNGQLICQKYDHNDPIILAIMEEQVPFADKFLCNKCLLIHRGVTKMTPINTVIDVIREKITFKNTEHEQLKQKSIRILRSFQQKMNDIKSKTMNHFDELYRISDQWIVDLENEKQINQEDLLTLFQEFEQINIQNEVVKKNKSYFIKTSLIFKHLFDFNVQKKCYEDLTNIITKQQGFTNNVKFQQEKQQQIRGSISSQLRSSQSTLSQFARQQEYCFAMAFNYTGSIMVAGCNSDLKVWKFQNGQLSEIQRLTGHSKDVRCIVFSKNLNWFASGSSDKAIRCWKEQYNNNWISSKVGQWHYDIVACLILNSSETELISCSCDKTIIVWKVNCEQNLLEYGYPLQNKHTDNVNCISMNEPETALVSCSDDKQIILWARNKYNKWIYQHHIKCDDFGYRICFINYHQIVWQQQGQGITKILKIENGQLILKPELTIELNKVTGDDWLFPTIFNQKKQIIIQKHNKYVYVLQKQNDDQLLLAQEPIDCKSECNYGALTNDGKYLVIWNEKNQEFRVININQI